MYNKSVNTFLTKEKKMHLNLINQIITNEESKKMIIEIIVDDKKYSIDSIKTDFENKVLKITTQQKQ